MAVGVVALHLLTHLTMFSSLVMMDVFLRSDKGMNRGPGYSNLEFWCFFFAGFVGPYSALLAFDGIAVIVNKKTVPIGHHLFSLFVSVASSLIVLATAVFRWEGKTLLLYMLFINK